MSVTLSIKNVPEDLVGRLRARAARNHRSLQGELLAIIEVAVPPEPEFLSPAEFLAMVRRSGVSSSESSVDLIRADRDRDDHR